MPCDIANVAIDVQVVEGAIQSDYWCVSLFLNVFFFIDLLIFSYIFLSGNWYGKLTAIDLYFPSWIRILSILLESAH